MRDVCSVLLSKRHAPPAAVADPWSATAGARRASRSRCRRRTAWSCGGLTCAAVLVDDDLRELLDRGLRRRAGTSSSPAGSRTTRRWNAAPPQLSTTPHCAQRWSRTGRAASRSPGSPRNSSHTRSASCRTSTATPSTCSSDAALIQVRAAAARGDRPAVPDPGRHSRGHKGHRLHGAARSQPPLRDPRHRRGRDAVTRSR